MKLTFIAFCIQFEGFVFWLSAHLFQLLGAETHVCLKAGQKLPFGEAETQLLHKSCILGEGVNAQDNYGPLEVHKKKKKSNACLNGIRWALPKITKLPLINGFSSHAVLIPLISSLYSILKLWSSTPLISSLFYPLRAATSLSVVSDPWIFFLFFFFLRLLQCTLICNFFKKNLFMSNLIWEIHFEGKDLINKTPSNTDLLRKTTRYQHWSNFFFTDCGKKIFRSCMLCSC